MHSGHLALIIKECNYILIWWEILEGAPSGECLTV